MAIRAANAEHDSMPAIIVDQRETERRELSHSAVVTVVGSPEQVLEGDIRNLSEGGTQIWLGEPLPPFTLVRIEYDDNLLLGEVVYCRQEPSGWLLGLRVEHVLFGLTALADSMQAF
jgi:hypothetical protein